MKNMFEPGTVKEIKYRINKLQPDMPRQWGKMEVAQMMAHCSAALEVATGQKKSHRILFGRIFGRLLKSYYLGEKPLRKNSPTDKSFIVIDRRNFEKEKTKLVELIDQFSQGGPAKVTKHPHSFFGKLKPAEWSRAMYKHLDHHLKQFGV